MKNISIIITGASKGIGFAIAEALHKQGELLTLVSRNIEENKNFTKWDKNRVLLKNADVSKEEDVKKVIAKAKQKFGKIDILINNAGQFLGKPLEKTELSEYEKIIDTNIKGIFLMSREVIPLLKKQKDGLIVNIGSKISHNANVAPNKVLYAASKYAVEGFSFALNRELKPFGIRVVCLMPATVKTFFTLRPKKFLPVDDVVSIVLMVINLKNIDFESIVFKSKYQDI